MKNFNDDFTLFTEKILSGENFAFARYADGEVCLMKGKEIGIGSQAFHVDKWRAPKEMTIVGEELLETLGHTEPNYYYAISAHTDSMDDYTFLTERIKTDNITFANLWINANYQKMKAFYMSFNREVYLICNHAASQNSYPFTVAEIFAFPDDCISYWEQYGDDYLRQLSAYISEIKNQTIFISAGPVSEILIHRLYRINPHNQYIDVGSSLDEFTHRGATRPYMNPESTYAKEISVFYE